jgi:hypothetical protein
MIHREVYDSSHEDERIINVERIEYRYKKWEVDLSYQKMIDEVFCLCMVYWLSKQKKQ